MLMKPASSSRAPALPPAEAGCRTATRKSAEDDAYEASELPARRRLAPGRSRLPDGGPQSAEDDADEAGELTARSSPSTSWSRDDWCDIRV